MSNTGIEMTYNNNILENYTNRQIKSSFQPLTQQQFVAPFQQSLYYLNQTIPSLPVDIVIPSSYDYTTSGLQQQGVVYTEYAPAVINTEQQIPTGTMRSDAPIFSPSNSTVKINSEIPPTSSFIYDLKKYKYDYFLTNLSCQFDRDFGKFGKPTGICTLNDDRLLVANFDHDSLILIDINGIVHQIYKDLPTPKDVLYYSSNLSQAVVATKKEVVILDLNTKQIVTRSKLKGFYPWNIQYIKEQQTFAACDPSGERLVFLNKDLESLGEWSFNDQNQGYPQTQPYEKVYPYAAYCLADGTACVLTHRTDQCHLRECDDTGKTKRFFNTPPTLKSYSIYVDNAKKCLIADKTNHQLLSIDYDSQIEEYKCKSIQEPHSMTFLSNGTLCVTDSSKSRGTNGGIAIISEMELKTN